MSILFNVVYELLDWLSESTGLTYHEVNVVAYYIVAPLIFLHLIDRILRRHLLAPLFAAAVAAFIVITPSFSEFSDWLFERSADFLGSFKALGWSYQMASVIICVFVPLAVFIVLLHYAYPSVLRLRPRRVAAPTR